MFRRKLFGSASRIRRERSIRPKISRIDFDLAELENSEVRPRRPSSPVDFHTGLEVDHVKSTSSDHLVNLVVMPKFVNQSFGAANHMGLKWRWTTKRVFEMADQLVHVLAKRELAALSACA